MQCYDAKDMARSFRTVRANTIKLAEEIPDNQYSFRAAEGTRTVGETLAHIATSTELPQMIHGPRHPAVTFDLFVAGVQKAAGVAATLTTKDQILASLRSEGEKFATFLEGFSNEALAERVQYPAGMQPPDKSRFEMLIAAKEHEMHHRGQLMLVQRMIGIVPHLTRDMQARMEQVQAQRA
jgi:uncharacterized damage-inducible protein DinB